MQRRNRIWRRSPQCDCSYSTFGIRLATTGLVDTALFNISLGIIIDHLSRHLSPRLLSLPPIKVCATRHLHPCRQSATTILRSLLFVSKVSIDGSFSVSLQIAGIRLFIHILRLRKSCRPRRNCHYQYLWYNLHTGPHLRASQGCRDSNGRDIGQ